jgi:hypothetical protein
MGPPCAGTELRGGIRASRRPDGPGTYASLRQVEHSALIGRVLAIPPRRFDKPSVSFRTGAEIDALIDVPDLS